MTKIDMADTRLKAAELADRAADTLRPPKPKHRGRMATLILAVLGGVGYAATRFRSGIKKEEAVADHQFESE